MTHTRHQIPETRSGCCQSITGMAQVMKSQMAGSGVVGVKPARSLRRRTVEPYRHNLVGRGAQDYSGPRRAAVTTPFIMRYTARAGRRLIEGSGGGHYAVTYPWQRPATGLGPARWDLRDIRPASRRLLLRANGGESAVFPGPVGKRSWQRV